MYGEMDVNIHVLLTSVIAGGEWSASYTGNFNPEERDLGNHCIGVWVEYCEVEKILNCTGPQTQTHSQPICNTHCATITCIIIEKYFK
jgi:hypothetical protein